MAPMTSRAARTLLALLVVCAPGRVSQGWGPAAAHAWAPREVLSTDDLAANAYPAAHEAHTRRSIGTPRRTTAGYMASAARMKHATPAMWTVREENAPDWVTRLGPARSCVRRGREGRG